MLLFDEILKRAKSGYAIGKNPNSHTKVGRRPGASSASAIPAEVKTTPKKEVTSDAMLEESFKNSHRNPLDDSERLVGFRDGGVEKWGAFTLADPIRLMGGPVSKRVEIRWLRAVTKGGGRATLQWLTDMADRHGLTLQLQAVPIATAMTRNKKMPQKKLNQFYESFGFQPQDDRDGHWFERPAKVKKSLILQPLTKKPNLTRRQLRAPEGRDRIGTQPKSVMKMFIDIFKARTKSAYAIGKHPNSHKRSGKRPGHTESESQAVTPDEVEALGRYQSYSFFLMNVLMRVTRGKPEVAINTLIGVKTRRAEDNQQTLDDIAKMRSLLHKSSKPLEKDTVLYRAVPDGTALFAPVTALGLMRDGHLRAMNDARKNLDKKLQESVGKEFVDHGIISTTLSESQATQWASRRGLAGSSPVLFRITARKGTKTFDPAEHIDQKEYIVKKERMLRPGTRFRVNGVSKHPKNSQFTVVDLEVVS